MMNKKPVLIAILLVVLVQFVTAELVENQQTPDDVAAVYSSGTGTTIETVEIEEDTDISTTIRTVTLSIGESVEVQGHTIILLDIVPFDCKLVPCPAMPEQQPQLPVEQIPGYIPAEQPGQAQSPGQPSPGQIPEEQPVPGQPILVNPSPDTLVDEEKRTPPTQVPGVSVDNTRLAERPPIAIPVDYTAKGDMAQLRMEYQGDIQTTYISEKMSTVFYDLLITLTTLDEDSVVLTFRKPPKNYIQVGYGEGVVPGQLVTAIIKPGQPIAQGSGSGGALSQNMVTIDREGAQVTVSAKADVVEVRSAGVTAATKAEVHIDNNELSVVTPSGNQIVRVLPSQAVAKVQEEYRVVTVAEPTLEIQNDLPVYEIPTTVEVKILGIFPKEMKVTLRVNAQEESVTEADAPWWRFLAT